MEQEPRNENYWANGGTPHQPVVIVGEQDPDADRKNNSLSVVSLVFGILSLVLFLVPWIAFILGLVGLITGIISLVQHRAGHGAAVGGVITSALGLLISFIILLLFILAIIMTV